jgi:hypothetical protein
MRLFSSCHATVYKTRSSLLTKLVLLINLFFWHQEKVEETGIDGSACLDPPCAATHLIR